MYSLADHWVRSGKKTSGLYHGTTDGIVKELKAWVERRKALNDAHIDEKWKFFDSVDPIQQLNRQSSEAQNEQAAGTKHLASAIMIKQMNVADHIRVSYVTIV